MLRQLKTEFITLFFDLKKIWKKVNINHYLIKIYEKVKEVNGLTYERISVKTRLLNFNDNLLKAIEEYVLPQKQDGDWLAISEKVVSVCQNNVRHISSVKARFLAKLIVKFVKKYPDDIGFSRAEKMQVAVEMAGSVRMVLAIILGVLGKVVGIKGIFWRVAGNRVSEIDGFNPDAMWPYTEYAILPPKNPEKTL